MKTDPDQLRLQKSLADLLHMKVDLTITNNRHNMISCRLDDGVMKLRLHRMFLFANGKLLRSLASFCKRPNKSNRKVVGDFIKEHHFLIENEKPKKTKQTAVRHKGNHFHLGELFEAVNTKYFKRACDAKITWGKESTQKRRRSMRLGSYDWNNNTIRIHPALDAGWVPRYVLENLIYHEILHWLFQPRQQGSRLVLHGQAFRDAERAHPQYERTKQWIEKNFPRLLKN